MIRHRPEAEIAGTPFCQIQRFIDTAAYRKAKALWVKQVERHRNDTAVLANAAGFHTLDEKRIAIAILNACSAWNRGTRSGTTVLGISIIFSPGADPAANGTSGGASRARTVEKALALLPTDSVRSIC